MHINETLPKPAPSLDDHMIPLINIVFLMLVFFMIAGQILPADVFKLNTLQLSQAENLKTHQQTLLIDKHGNLAWDQHEIALSQLTSTLTPLHLPELRIKADAGLPADTFISILDQLNKAGIDHFVIIAEQEAG
ncbi:ExbD/TolR family protein [Gynuella sp.]|uniref:ExbD/TolR family protein n=1 Tax=Gynuella sp. TaxID=2969146 RepID=UPI003D0ADC0C